MKDISWASPGALQKRSSEPRKAFAERELSEESGRIDDGMQQASIRHVEYLGSGDPEADDVVDKLLVRHLTYEEKQNMIDPVVDTGPQTVYRMRFEA